MFLQQFLHGRHVEHLLGDDALELRILRLERLQPPGVTRLHATVLLAPGVERRRADPVAPADLVHLRPGLLLLHTPMIFSSLNRLCFMALPPSSIQKWKIPVRNGPVLGGKVTCDSLELVHALLDDARMLLDAARRNHEQPIGLYDHARAYAKADAALGHARAAQIVYARGTRE